jgi:hypothetical protein
MKMIKVYFFCLQFGTKKSDFFFLHFGTEKVSCNNPHKLLELVVIN